MTDNTKLYRENYETLPKRFVIKLEKDIEYILESDIPGLKGLYLFGSCARGEVRSSSDIDLLILTEKKLKDRALVSDIRCTLEEEIDSIKTDVVFMNEDSIKEKTVFKNAVNRDKKKILEVV